MGGAEGRGGGGGGPGAAAAAHLRPSLPPNEHHATPSYLSPRTIPNLGKKLENVNVSKTMPSSYGTFFGT